MSGNHLYLIVRYRYWSKSLTLAKKSVRDSNRTIKVVRYHVDSGRQSRLPVVQEFAIYDLLK